MMELVDLRYLVSAAETGKLLHVAKALSVDVSTVSRRISALENELGISLLERDHSGVRLTTGGRLVANLARRILANVEEIKYTANHIALGNTGVLRLGLRVPPISGHAQALLTKWRDANREIVLSIMEGSHRELAIALNERRIDLALITGLRGWPRVASKTLFRERLVAALPCEHSLAVHQSLTWKMLSAETVLVQDWEDNHTQREFYALFLGSGARFQGHAASKQTILALVEAGYGVTFVPESSVAATAPGIVFRPLDDENACLDFDLVWPPVSEDPLVGRFVAFMRDESRTLGVE